MSAATSSAPSAPSQPPGRPRVGPWKAGLLALLLLLLAPLGLAYGVLGRVLTATPKTLARVGTAALVVLSAAVLLEVLLVEREHAHEFEAAAARQSDADRLLHELEGERKFAQTLALLAASLIALLVGQWRAHALVAACIDAGGAPLSADNGLRLLVDTLAPLFLVALLWDSLLALEHWRFVTGLTLGAWRIAREKMWWGETV